MTRVKVVALAVILALAASVLPASYYHTVLAAQPAAVTESGGTVDGTIVHILESPAEVAGNPSLASITNAGMSCSVSFGNDMGGTDNFGMVVYSEGPVETVVVGRMAVQWGKARSITIKNGEIEESALYSYLVLVQDVSDGDGQDHWSMTLWGDGLMFDGVTFAGPVTVGDLVVQAE